MSHFPDTSFLYALYRNQPSSPAADQYMVALQSSLRVSSLLLLEFRQSVRLQIRLHLQDRTKGFSSSEGTQMLRDLQADISSGTLSSLPVDWADVHHLAEGLSAKYTPTKGYRFADILHLATALHLGTSEFLTFDGQQKKLATAEGLHVPW
ncbi:MAG: PilT protein domain protein [Verrucomicrobiaceae bacterium]|nr:PilT protein domain protein [Verrucomicrobiaceae bacterium]